MAGINNETDDGNVPVDATAMQAEAIVKAAIAWWLSEDVQMTDKFTRAEHDLMRALENYGEKFKGLRAR